MDTVAINLFAGPGSGKSTLRAEVFSRLKWAGVLVEEVTEFAKDVVWDESLSLFKDQLYTFAEQWHRMERLRGKVAYIITDSPAPIQVVHAHLYGKPDAALDALMWDRFHSFSNLNIFLRRTKPYVPVGRFQDEAGAHHLDGLIHAELVAQNILFTDIVADVTAADKIVALVRANEQGITL